MPERIVIADASCLIALLRIDQLEVLHSLYQEILITSIIWDEVGEVLPDWIAVEAVEDQQKVKLLELELDQGEASAIALALQMEDPLLIIDEKKGRAVAKRLGLRVTGTLGIIVKAKERGYLSAAKPVLDRLMDEGFRMSDLLFKQILHHLGES
ncbi:MAG: DUF3368 domain-containing protein [Lewinella sp.]|nr:DUF3368 domain-containing protein [Lewinella sp.]